MKSVKILLLSSWQTVNIGDIAHTPGLLNLVYGKLPQADIYLYGNVENGVKEMLSERFPQLKFVTSQEEYLEKCKTCNFLLHGSGPSVVASRHIETWRQLSDKPYGIMGVTINEDTLSPVIIDQINDSQFTYLRDSKSLELVQKAGAKGRCLKFGPDAAFATDLSNAVMADKFCVEAGLKDGKFMCCIPRLRYTPYWLIKPGHEIDQRKQARNEAMVKHDHAPLIESIIRIVRETDMKVLLCPEDRTQMEVGRKYIYEELPQDVKGKVVWKNSYWLTDEARSVYQKSAGLFGLEMHSPILCIGSGIPAIVGRFAEQTTKGYMWDDIGLGQWLFDMDVPEEYHAYSDAVLEMALSPSAAKETALKAKVRVEQRQAEMMDSLIYGLNH